MWHAGRKLDLTIIAAFVAGRGLLRVAKMPGTTFAG